jgi:hypothetical protein
VEAICSSETSVDTQWTTQRYIPEDGTLHNHCCENLKSYKADLLKDFTIIYQKVEEEVYHRKGGGTNSVLNLVVRTVQQDSNDVNGGGDVKMTLATTMML